MHTVYVPADRYTTELTTDWGAQALAAIDEHETIFRDLVGDDALVARVRTKLAAQPIEDLRIDFEDGYGNHSEEAEDSDVARTAGQLAESVGTGTAPPFTGIRIKSLEVATRARGVRTLARFMSVLTHAGTALTGFVVTLPKVTTVDQVAAMVYLCTRLERQFALDERALRFELQIETPQSIVGADGSALVARMIHASDGRCTGLHFGTYDYTAYVGIAAGNQSLAHPAADHAKLVMQAAAAGTGVRLSDGSTNLLPIGDATSVRTGWTTHLQLVRRGLERGFYQGWDLHPAQLPSRYAATFGFYSEGFAAAAGRVRDHVERHEGSVLDEPATVRALADFLVRAVHCGAATTDEIESATTQSLPQLVALARAGSVPR